MQRTALLCLASMALGCSTDLEINAPYQDITIVHGLLNMRDSIQYIKVNKAFLGEGDALVYAQIQDSNEWQPDAITYAKVFRRLNGAIVDSFPLYDTLLTNREPGVFHAPEQTVHYFKDSFRDQVLQNGIPTTMYLDEESDYALELMVKGQRINATTNVVNDFSFQAADQSLTIPVNLMDGSDYGGFELNWSSDLDGKRYEAKYRFNYREVRGTDTTGILSFSQRITNVVNPGTGGGISMAGLMEGELFFSTLVNRIPADPTVDKRIFMGLDFIVSVANDEFHTFLTLSEPVSGIIEDRPSYTNINNGYGIFASRYDKFILNKGLGGTTLAELVDGPITAQLRFCTGRADDVNSPHYCAP